MPSPTLKFPHSLFSYRPRPPPPPPHTTRLHPCQPTRPLAYYLLPFPCVWVLRLGLREPQEGFINAPGWDQTGNRLCPEMLSALAKRPVGGALEKGMQLPRPLFANWLGLSLGGSAAGQGAFCSLAPSREVEGHRIPFASRDSTLSLLPHSLRSLCPPVPARGLVHSPPDRTVQLG